MDLKELLLGYLAKQHGISEDEAADLILKKAEDKKTFTDQVKDNALAQLLDKDTARVQTLKKASVDETALFDQAFNKAKKEVTESLEKKISKKYNVSEDNSKLKLLELVDHVITSSEKTSKKAGEVTEDVIKVHPLYLKLEKEKNEEAEALKAEHEKNIDKLKGDYTKKENFGTAKSHILTHFLDLKPVLPEDAAKARNQQNDFLSKFEGYDFNFENGQPLILQEGKRVEDAHGNPVTLKSLVQTEASKYFDFRKQTDKGASGNNNGFGDQVKIPQSEEEFSAAIFNAKTSEERIAIGDAYEAANK